MTKEQILSYIGKGDVNHNGYIIDVTKRDLRHLDNVIMVELKAINKFTDSPIHTIFLDYTSQEDLDRLEKNLEYEIEFMKKQVELNNKEPLKLRQIDNLSSSYEATFKDEENNKYVLMKSGDRCTLNYYDTEPYYSIKTPVEIDEKVIYSNYSFWMGSGFYKAEDFEFLLKKHCEYKDKEEGLII